MKLRAAVVVLALPAIDSRVFSPNRLDGCSTVIYYHWQPVTAGSHLPLLSRKGILAIAAVVDVAIHGKDRPVPAKALAARHRLPPRHLEPVLQALVRDGILKGIRGRQGGYAMARERRRISADDILRAASLADEPSQPPLPSSALIHQAILPILRDAEQALSTALGRISIADITERAEHL